MITKLRELRDLKRMSLRDLAAAVGIDQAALSRMELGTQKMFMYQAVILADFFKVSLDYLMNRPTMLAPERPITLERVMGVLPSLPNMELARIMGACETILLQRTQNGKKAESSDIVEPVVLGSPSVKR